MRFVGAVVLTLVMAATPLAGQSRARTAVDTTRVTVGDRITVTVTVEHPPEAAVVWPDSLSLAPFELLEARVLESEREGDLVRSTGQFTLTAFELGELEIPSFEVEVVGRDGSTEVLQTDRYGVEVASVGMDESGDIREIRGPLGIPLGALRLALWLLLPLLLGGLLYGLARRLRPRREDESARPLGPPPRPAHEVALEALDALASSPLLGRGQVKEYHIIVSDILRTYVEERFRVDALEMTTREVLAGLGRVGVGAPFTAELGRFLEQCDLVKFAKARPDTDASIELLELGRRLVRESAPRTPSAGEAEAA